MRAQSAWRIGQRAEREAQRAWCIGHSVDKWFREKKGTGRIRKWEVGMRNVEVSATATAPQRPAGG
jgi:hypothetical protein